MRISLLRESLVNDLKNSIKSNLVLYRSGSFVDLLEQTGGLIETSLELDETRLAPLVCATTKIEDLAACQAVYEGLPGLTPYLARDERLWVFLTHTVLLNYARLRWAIPAERDASAGVSLFEKSKTSPHSLLPLSHDPYK